MGKETLFNILEITRMFSHCVIVDCSDDARISWDFFRCAVVHQCKKSEAYLNFFRLQDLVPLQLLFVRETCSRTLQFELSSV